MRIHVLAGKAQNRIVFHVLHATIGQATPNTRLPPPAPCSCAGADVSAQYGHGANNTTRGYQHGRRARGTRPPLLKEPALRLEDRLTAPTKAADGLGQERLGEVPRGPLEALEEGRPRLHLALREFALLPPHAALNHTRGYAFLTGAGRMFATCVWSV